MTKQSSQTVWICPDDDRTGPTAARHLILGYEEEQSGRETSGQHRSAYHLNQSNNCSIVIQGTASDMIKLAMLNVERSLKIEWQEIDIIIIIITTFYYYLFRPPNLLRPRLLMQIHDELIFEIPIYSDKSLNTSFISLLHRCMEKEVVDHLQLKIPIIINVKSGENWGDLKQSSY